LDSIIQLHPPDNNWRIQYRYGLYSHKLIAANGEVYARHFIVVKNRYGLIARFTRLHNYVGVYDGKVFAPQGLSGYTVL